MAQTTARHASSEACTMPTFCFAEAANGMGNGLLIAFRVGLKKNRSKAKSPLASVWMMLWESS